MNSMKLIVAALTLLWLFGCGFVDQTRACECYIDHMWPENNAVLLGTWPFHVIMLGGCVVVDQGARTAESVVPAGRDAYDYLTLPVNDDNIMLHRTVVVPKTLATPLIFVGSYAARWLAPIEEDDHPFQR